VFFSFSFRFVIRLGSPRAHLLIRYIRVVYSHSIGTVYLQIPAATPPAATAPKLAKNHSGELKPTTLTTSNL